MPLDSLSLSDSGKLISQPGAFLSQAVSLPPPLVSLGRWESAPTGTEWRFLAPMWTWVARLLVPPFRRIDPASDSQQSLPVSRHSDAKLRDVGCMLTRPTTHRSRLRLTDALIVTVGLAAVLGIRRSLDFALDPQ